MAIDIGASFGVNGCPPVPGPVEPTPSMLPIGKGIESSQRNFADHASQLAHKADAERQERNRSAAQADAATETQRDDQVSHEQTARDLTKTTIASKMMGAIDSLLHRPEFVVE